MLDRLIANEWIDYQVLEAECNELIDYQVLKAKVMN